MNKAVLILVVVVILAILITAGYFIFYGNNGSHSATPNTSVSPAQPQNLTASVSIKNFAFNPATLTVKLGTTVTWTNQDSAPHQIKSATFNSAALSNGQTFSFTFSTAGQYNYSCAIHPSMRGQIIVTQ